MTRDRHNWEERYASAATRPHAGATGEVVLEPPSPFLVLHADRITGRVLDVAAGAGRNALFLAQRGNLVEAIDIAHSGLRRARATADAIGVGFAAIQADLESYPLPPNRYDAIINIRYLQRSLFGSLQHALKPGAILLFETFLIDQQAFGHPKNPEFLLQRGELRHAFRGCEILVYEEGLFEEGQNRAYLARLLARRRDRD